MKRFLIAVAITAATITSPALAADVGVSISLGQPGFFGQIDIGDFPQPRVIFREPIIIKRGIPMDRPPVYLRVPPGHAKKWRKHCHEYNACGERVLFVHDDWYEHEYVPRYREKHHERRHKDKADGHKKKKKKGKGHDHNR